MSCRSVGLFAASQRDNVKNGSELLITSSKKTIS